MEDRMGPSIQANKKNKFSIFICTSNRIVILKYGWGKIRTQELLDFQILRKLFCCICLEELHQKLVVVIGFCEHAASQKRLALCSENWSSPFVVCREKDYQK
jgi:hypothetical protein